MYVKRHVRWSLQSLSRKLAGAQIHIGHLEHHNLTARDLCECVGSCKLLILYRESLADQFVSWQLARQSNRWVGNSQTDIHTKKIKIIPEEFSTFCNMIQQRYLGVMQTPGVRESSTVLSYEELCELPNQVFTDRIFPLLGQSPVAIHSKMIKQNRRPLSETVTNYKDLEPLLRNAQQSYSLASTFQ